MYINHSEALNVQVKISNEEKDPAAKINPIHPSILPSILPPNQRSARTFGPSGFAPTTSSPPPQEPGLRTQVRYRTAAHAQNPRMANIDAASCELLDLEWWVTHGMSRHDEIRER
ncbi:hypothetical protein EYC84_004046 [Monilinia fructicola]|uniref:Uncharacterized protein n=1 Tax=Monilinia fructicola TaxID=38448 RepID=A0A5M9JZ35_MONFR|nr:hypothetical protein EYC84_004046 [Monilinia fructicola]